MRPPLFSEVDNDPGEWHHPGGGSCPYCTAHHDVAEARLMNGNKVLRLLAAATEARCVEMVGSVECGAVERNHGTGLGRVSHTFRPGDPS